MQDVVWVNDVDLDDLYFRPTALGGWSDARRKVKTKVQIPGAARAHSATLDVTEPRLLRISGELHGSTHTEKATRLSALLAHLGGTCVLKFGDKTGKYITGELTEAPTVPAAPSAEFMSGGWWNVTLGFTCDDPAYYDVTATVTALTSTPANVNIGSMPHGGVVRITGPATNARLVYSGGGGKYIQLIGSIAGAATVDIDLTERKLAKSGGGNPYLLLDPDWGNWFMVDPGHKTLSDVLVETLPQMSVTGLSGGSASYTYRRRYAA